MKRKIIAAALAVVGLATVSNLAYAPKAQAERVFDVSSMTWKTVDPNRRKYTRKAPPKKFHRRMVAVRTNQAPGTIIIHTDAKYLYLVQNRNKALRYGVGVGREGFTWAANNLKVQRKAEWPSWTPPPEMIAREAAQGHKVGYMEGGEDNPLGARAMYLFKDGRDTQYRIHGTNQPWSIGLNLSSGCIRMMNKDVTDLYSRVPVGSKVIVVGEGQDASRYISETYNPLALVSTPKWMKPRQKAKPVKIEKATPTAKVAKAKQVSVKPSQSLTKEANAKPKRKTIFGQWKKLWQKKTPANKAAAQ